MVCPSSRQLRFVRRDAMKRTVLSLVTVATLGLSAIPTSALAGGLVAVGGLAPAPYAWGSRQGPIYYAGYTAPAYDSYAFAYEYPIYTGRTVTAIAVELVNSRFRHRRVTGPGIAYYRSEYPNW